MATIKSDSLTGSVTVPAGAGVSSVEVVAITDGEGALVGFDTGGVKVSAVSPLDAGGVKVSQASSTPQSSTAAANTAVVQTFAAVAAQVHRLTMLAVSYSAAPTGGRVTVADGGTTILDLDVTAAGTFFVPLPDGGLKGTVNTAMTVTLAAAGAAVVGKVNSGRVTA